MDMRHLLGYAAPYRWPLALTACFMLLEAVATLAIPWLGGQLASGLLLDGGADLQLVLWALIAAFACQALLRFANGYISSRTAQRLLADLRVRVYDHLQALPLSFHQARRQGETLALVTWEVAQLSSFISGTLLSILPLVLTVGGAAFLMFRLDPLLAVMVAGLVPLFYLALKLLGRRLRGLAVELQRSNARAVGIAEENLSMLPAIKTFTREAEESERYGREIARVMQLSITQQRIYAALEPTIHFLAGTAAVLLLWLGSQRLGDEGMTPAELVSFLLYAALLTRPVSALAGLYGQVQTARGTLERLHGVLTEPAEPIFHPAPALGRVTGAITFEGVGLAYPGRAPTLENVDLHIPAGATAALCGANGAGKSTLVHLLMRLHEPSAGRILIDGTDIATVNLQSLRRQIGVVPQHTAPLQRHGCREHRLRPHRRRSGRDRARRPDGPGARLRHPPARRLCHPDRRPGPAPLGRPAPAPGPRPRSVEGPARPDPRRGHLDVRPRGRARLHRGCRRSAGPAHRYPDHPPPGEFGARRTGLFGRGRPGPRAAPADAAGDPGMSGISGFVHLDGRPADPANLARMTNLLERRGPDGTGHWHDGPVALGHTLLATTPESLHETLPLRHPETGCVITADVRFDNRPELLEALGAGRRLADAGDGTLLLEAYLRWDEACVDRLLGDFAFAIWDPRVRRLFCARDHMGMRQLIYCHVADRLFAFATEPRAVLQVEGMPRRLNEARLGDYLADMETADATSTFFEEVYRLPPAHLLKVDAHGLQIRRYWTLVPGPPLELSSDAAYAEAFSEVFTEAVRCRLRAPPGKLGSMLSGGIDSGSVVAVASHLLAKTGQGPLRTFSAVGPDPESCIETRMIRASMTLPRLAPEVVDHSDLGPWKGDLLRLVCEVDEPFDTHMNLVRVVYLAAHRANLNVMLDGVGGDTVLTQGTQIARLLRSGRWVQAVRDAVGEERFWGPALPTWHTLAQSARTAFVPQWLRRARYRARRYFGALSVAHDSLIDPVFARRIDLPGRKASLSQRPPRHRPSHAEERASSIVNTPLLVGQERYDRVAAALSIEPRDPFVDLRMVGFCLRLPGTQLAKDGWPKLILRRAMDGLLPEAVVWRRGKEHLGWTFTRTLFTHWASWCHADANDIRTVSSYVRSNRLPTCLLDNGDTRVQKIRINWPSNGFAAASELNLAHELDIVMLTEWLKHVSVCQLKREERKNGKKDDTKTS